MTKPVMQKRTYRMISLVMAFLMSVVLLFSVPVLPASALSYTNWPSFFKVNHTLAPTVGGVLSDSVNVSAISALDMQKGKIYTLTVSLSAMKTPSLGTYYNAYVDSAILYINGVASYGVKNGDNFTFTVKGTATGNVSAVPYIRATCRFSPLTPGAVSTNDNFYFDIKVVSQSMTDDPDYTPPPPLPVPEFGWMTTAANINNILVPPGTYGDITTTISFPTTSFPYTQFSPGHRYFIRFSIYPDASRFPAGLSYWLTDVELNIGGCSFPAAYNYLNRSYVISVVNDGSFFPTSHASISATVHLASSSSVAVSVQPHFSLNVDTQVINVFPISGQVVTAPGVEDAIKDQTAAIEKGTQDQIDNANKNHDDLTNGYDNSAGTADNDRLSGSLGSLDEMEEQATGDAIGHVKSFSFSSILDFSAQLVSALSFLGVFVDRFLYASGEFSVIPVIAYALGFLAIVTGIFRFVRSSTEVHNSSGK